LNLYTLALDTNTHATKFDSDLFAYLSSRNVSPKIKQLFEHYLMDVLCLDGKKRPYSIILTPGWFHDGLGNYYREDRFNEKEAIDKYNVLLYQFLKNNIKEPKDFFEWKKRHPPIKVIRRWPAYLSIGVHFKADPPSSLIEYVKNRCKYFLYPSIKIAGFRLLRHQYHD
jgi:hypothetical protein